MGQQEPPQKVHAQGEQNMFEDNPNLNNTNLENNIFIIFDSFQHFSKHSLTQTMPFTFSIDSLLLAALLESTVEQQEPPQKVHARGKDYMINNSINLNTNLLTQTTLLTSLASLLQ